MKSTRGFKREFRCSHLPEERSGNTGHPRRHVCRPDRPSCEREQWRHCQHERSQARVSLPKEANREARFKMAMNGRGPRNANALFRSFDRPQRAMFVHQCTTVPTLTRSRAHQLWAAMPGNVLPMSPGAARNEQLGRAQDLQQGVMVTFASSDMSTGKRTGSTRHVVRSMRACLRRGVPADHEGHSQTQRRND